MILSRDATPKIDGRLARVVSAAQRRCAGSGPMLAMLLAAAYVYFLRQPTVLTAPTLWAVAAGLRDDADPGSQPHCDSE